jgi:hypothetical protein
LGEAIPAVSVASASPDPDVGVAVAILTNGNRSLPEMVRRFAPLATRARRL